jgi:uncharacterized membrane-anchored protein
MEPRSMLAKSLMLLGVVLFVIGLIVFLAPKIPWLGKLPGDIHFRGKNFRVDFPLATSILISIFLSILLTVILNLLNFFRK